MEFCAPVLSTSRSSRRGYKPRLLLYGMGDWSHGRVYTDICNEFSARFNIDFINWWQHGLDLPWGDFAQVYDIIMLDLQVVLEYVENAFADPAVRAKILPIVHGPQAVADYTLANKENRLHVYASDKARLAADMDLFKLHACVSPNTVHAVSSTVPETQSKLRLTPLAVSPDNFQKSTFTRRGLNTLGYFTLVDPSYGQGINTKRGHLAQKVSEQTGVPLLIKADVSFRVMDLWYQKIDAYLMTSIYESGPLPLLEAGICGIPVVAAPAGMAPQVLQHGGGVLTETFDEDEYVNTAVRVVNYWRANPADLTRASQQIRDNTMRNHAWTEVKRMWYRVFEEFLDSAL